MKELLVLEAAKQDLSGTKASEETLAHFAATWGVAHPEVEWEETTVYAWLDFRRAALLTARAVNLLLERGGDAVAFAAADDGFNEAEEIVDWAYRIGAVPTQYRWIAHRMTEIVAMWSAFRDEENPTRQDTMDLCAGLLFYSDSTWFSLTQAPSPVLSG